MLSSNIINPIDYRDSKTYYVSYVDVLGYNDVIKNDKEPEKLLNAIIGVINNLIDVIGKLPKFQDAEPPKINYNIISDGIVINIGCWEKPILLSDHWDNYTNFMLCVMLTANIQKTYLSHGFLCKGGLSYGKLVNEGKIIFGEGLAKAVDIEHNNHNPCVVIDDKVVELFLQSLIDTGQDFDDKQIGRILIRDGDKTFLHYMSADAILDVFIGKALEGDGREYLAVHKEGLEKALKRFINNHREKGAEESVADKYRWSIAYHDENNASDDNTLLIDKTLHEELDSIVIRKD